MKEGIFEEMIRAGLSPIEMGLVNNPAICIKGNGNFACTCEPCMKEFQDLLDNHFKPQ